MIRNDPDFHNDIQRLIMAIGGERRTTPQNTSPSQPTKRRGCGGCLRVPFILALLVLVLVGGGLLGSIYTEPTVSTEETIYLTCDNSIIHKTGILLPDRDQVWRLEYGREYDARLTIEIADVFPQTPDVGLYYQDKDELGLDKRNLWVEFVATSYLSADFYTIRFRAGIVTIYNLKITEVCLR